MIKLLLQRIPALQNESIQVLVFVVGPLVILLLAIIIDLLTGKRVVANKERMLFRPSLAVRSGWIFALAALATNFLRIGAKSYVMIVSEILMIAELLRTFPGSIQIDNEGIRWFSGWRRSFLRWEDVLSFVHRGSKEVLSEEHRVYGRSGQRLSIYQAYYTSYGLIVAQIVAHLRAKQVNTSSTEPESLLETFHKWLAICCAAIILASFLQLRF